MQRRTFIAGIGGAAAWPLIARAQQRAVPLVGFISLGASGAFERYARAFRMGLAENGYVEGQNVQVEYRWLEGRFERIAEALTDFIRRRVAVIASPGNTATALAAKAATTTIPIVFGVPDNPVSLGLVASLARPGGNATGMNYFIRETVSKALGLMHDLLPKAVRIAVLVNPSNPGETGRPLEDVQNAARVLRFQIETFTATNSREIEEAFAALARERVDGLFIVPDSYFASRVVQLAILAARYQVPTVHSFREFAEAGGLMSYGTDISTMYRQVGAYTGQILKGAKPADLPVVQSTRFEFVINMPTARALGIDVPPQLLAITDEVIE